MTLTLKKIQSQQKNTTAAPNFAMRATGATRQVPLESACQTLSKAPVFISPVTLVDRVVS